jgi:hypothetical protein
MTARHPTIGATRLPGALNRALWLPAILLLAACANKPPAFVAAPAQPDKGSVVYIYRPSSSSNFMYSPKVVIDENEKFSLGNGDYRYVYLQAGDHAIGLGATGQYSTDAPTVLRVEADKSYYLRVGTVLKFEKDGMNTRKFWIDTVDENTALNEIAKTEYAGLESAQPQEAQTDQPDSEPGFSVDKTQDPFAGKSR